ncbi:hypothetical protein GCM10010328_66170 [Streptomyces rubiginosohelvolus]|uniref:Uncharacterized protein n=1 Tax=Streptomyces rubiginosohelvolus TaxID=67362 RepID=A0ABQ3CC43_9ACTN|nr:hypothetical protein GCM10010328_66170 [Streptomyces pluricolorescens]
MVGRPGSVGGSPTGGLPAGRAGSADERMGRLRSSAFGKGDYTIAVRAISPWEAAGGLFRGMSTVTLISAHG